MKMKIIRVLNWLFNPTLEGWYDMDEGNDVFGINFVAVEVWIMLLILAISFWGKNNG